MRVAGGMGSGSPQDVAFSGAKACLAELVAGDPARRPALADLPPRFLCEGATVAMPLDDPAETAVPLFDMLLYSTNSYVAGPTASEPSVQGFGAPPTPAGLGSTSGSGGSGAATEGAGTSTATSGTYRGGPMMAPIVAPNTRPQPLVRCSPLHACHCSCSS